MAKIEMIDAHQHLWDPAGNVESLFEEYGKAGIKKVCIFGLGEQYRQPGNERTLDLLRKHPDFIVGFAYFRLGVDSPGLVGRFYKEGFRGLKVISPRNRYSAKEFYPVYEKAAEFGMPILFHTGIVSRYPTDGEYDVASERMLPIFLDAIARAFPELTVIGAHLGDAWINEACAVAANNPNVYFDLSGIIYYIYKKPKSFFESFVFWEEAKSKLIFGVDREYTGVHECIEQYNLMLDTVGFNMEEKKMLFCGHMENILEKK